MRVFVAEATGATGKQLAPGLAAGGVGAGEEGGAPMTELRGASKAGRELGWQPGHPSWRRGFAT